MNNIQLENDDKEQLVTDRLTVHLYVRQLAIYHRLYIIIMYFLIPHTSSLGTNYRRCMSLSLIINIIINIT
jgi:hypothetical protein